jgi:lipopolysaccharide transport system permease protein
MSSANTTNILTETPVLRITPVQGWWEVDFHELWHFRELVYFFVWRDTKVRYQQTAIGASWAILQPALTMTVFALFFGKLAHMPTEGLPIVVFYYSGLLPWMYFSNSLGNATAAIVQNQGVITKVYFPRLVLPISAVVSGLLDFAISLLLVIPLLAYYHVRPGLPLVLFPAFLLLAILMALGAGLWLSAMNAMYRDIRYVVPFLLQFWLFASPVAYASSIVPAKYRWLYGLNPMAGVIEGFRWSLTGRGDPPGLMIIPSVLVALTVLATGLIYFQRMESTVADVV